MARIRNFLLLAIAALALSGMLATTAGAANRIGAAVALGGSKKSAGETTTSTGSTGTKSTSGKTSTGKPGTGTTSGGKTKETAPVTQPTPPPTISPEAASGPLYWGATIGSQLTGTQAPWDMSAVTKFEEMTQKKLSMIQFFQPFANCSGATCSFYGFPTSPLENIRQHGSIPVLSWSSQSTPSSVNEPDFQLSDLISGRYDAYIREFAEKAKTWGHPFFLRFNWEMNGSWFPWSEGVNGNQPGEFVTAWRHVHDIFTSVGATNASWVWCPNAEPNNTQAKISSLYPGDAYVDWTGMDGYNWGTNPVKPGGWKTFDQIFASTYSYIQAVAPSKPVMVGEVASTESGGSKAAWIQEMLRDVPTEFGKIRALLWFDKYDSGMDWPLETSSTATSAFAESIQSTSYATNTFGSLAPLAIQPLS